MQYPISAENWRISGGRGTLVDPYGRTHVIGQPESALPGMCRKLESKLVDICADNAYSGQLHRQELIRILRLLRRASRHARKASAKGMYESRRESYLRAQARLEIASGNLLLLINQANERYGDDELACRLTDLYEGVQNRLSDIHNATHLSRLN